MPGRGLFLAVDDHMLKQLRATKGDRERRDFIPELEEVIDPRFKQDTDKAWELLFVAFFTGKSSCDIAQTDWFAMSTIFRGAKNLHRGDSYILNWLAKAEVPAMADRLAGITHACLRERYDTLNQGWFHRGIYKGDDVQFAYIAGWCDRMVTFFKDMRTENRHILFTSTYN